MGAQLDDISHTDGIAQHISPVSAISRPDKDSIIKIENESRVQSLRDTLHQGRKEREHLALKEDNIIMGQRW